MARLVVSEHALTDLERITDFLISADIDHPENILELILDALFVLERHPLIGRLVDDWQRELVIGHGHSGYVALYRYSIVEDRVDILAIRHQREAGYG